jgi:hypothetical protein
VNVRGGDGAVRLDRDLDLDELAFRVGRGAEEANRLAGDGILDRVAGADGSRLDRHCRSPVRFG